MSKKYLLSTGQSTESREKYIVDIFRLNISIWPNEIPNSTVGFDFIMTDTKKDELERWVRSKIDELINRIQTRLECDISVSSLKFLGSDRVNIEIKVNNYLEEVSIGISSSNI